MSKQATKTFIHQNLGLVDRIFRVLLGTVMLGIPYFLLLQHGAVVQWWQSSLMALSVYPFLTGILGTDPVYRLFHIKTCDLSNRNQCGSFPFQVDAMAGHNPIADSDLEHTLLHSHHEEKNS